MTWRGPGFVDHHTHLLHVSAGAPAPWARDGVAAYHRAVAARGSTPMDEVAGGVGIPGPELDARLLHGLERAARLGLCEVTEAGLRDWAEWEALRRLREHGPLPVRVRVFAASGIAHPAMVRTGDPLVELVGVKFYADGWLGPRTCACSEPFADAPGQAGVAFLDAATLARRAAPFAEQGWRLATHAIGDAAIEAVLDAYERIYAGDGAALAAAGHRVEHAQVLRADLVERMRSLGVVACIQPGFASSDAAAARAALAGRWPLAYRWDALLAAGVRVIGGSDFPIEPLDPLLGLQQLATGAAGAAGEPPLVPPLAFADALALVTDPGAGCTVLDADPATVAPEALTSLRVLGTEPAGA